MADSGGWVVLGTAIGTSGSIATSWLNAWLTKRNNPEAAYDAAATKLLTSMLTKGPERQELWDLAIAVGLSHELTKQYLVELGARGYSTKPETWGLISRDKNFSN